MFVVHVSRRGSQITPGGGEDGTFGIRSLLFAVLSKKHKKKLCVFVESYKRGILTTNKQKRVLDEMKEMTTQRESTAKKHSGGV